MAGPCQRAGRRAGWTSGQAPLGGPAPATGGPSRQTSSHNRGTSATGQPMRCAGSTRVAASGWRWPGWSRRVWLGGAGSAPRDMPLSRRLISGARRCRAPSAVGLPEGWCTDIRAVQKVSSSRAHPPRWAARRRRAERPQGSSATRVARRRYGAPSGGGDPARVETLRRREGAGGSNTADSERQPASAGSGGLPWPSRPGAGASHPAPAPWPVSDGDRVNACTRHESQRCLGDATSIRPAGITRWLERPGTAVVGCARSLDTTEQRGRPSQALNAA